MTWCDLSSTQIIYRQMTETRRLLNRQLYNNQHRQQPLSMWAQNQKGCYVYTGFINIHTYNTYIAVSLCSDNDNIYWYIVIYWAGYRIYQHNLSTLSNLTRKCTCVSGEVGNIVRTAELLGIYSGAETSACAEIGLSKFRWMICNHCSSSVSMLNRL